MMPALRAWVRHVGTPFRPPLSVLRTQDDDRRLAARAWGAPLAQSSLRYVADTAVSFGVRAALTVPVAVWATTAWAWHRPQAPWAWILIAPWCGLVGGAVLSLMGLLCDAIRIGVMTGLAAGNYVYALGQGAADVVQDSWIGHETAPDVFAFDRAATARAHSRAQAQASPWAEEAL